MPTSRELSTAYKIAKNVYLGSIRQAEGARRLHEKLGMNKNSAIDLIRGYKHMRRGEVFHRTISAPYMRFYLSHILAENGGQALHTALHALWLHIHYYEGHENVTLRTMRQLATEFQASAGVISSAAQVSVEFENAVKRSLSDTNARRRRRLNRAPKLPERAISIVVGFVRNPDVVAEVLLRANGRCESCAKMAPFLRRKDGTPYLEIHHVQRLADGGEDTVENAVALCPNCHRKQHFGPISEG